VATATKNTGTGERLQSWVPTELAEELKRHAEGERRSISAVIRLAIEERLAEPRRRP
jgi:hypothetical protein